MWSALRIPLLSALFILVWSSGWIGSKYALNYANALGFLAWRYLFVVLILFVLVTALNQWQKLSKRELWQQASVGLLCHTAYLSFAVAAIEAGVNSGMVAFITAMQPLMTLAIAYPILNERINLRQAIGIALGMLSVVVVIGLRISVGGSILIYALPVFSVFSLTIASVLCRYSETRKLAKTRSTTPLLLVMFIQSVAALVGFILLAWRFGDFSMQLTPNLFYSMTYMVVVVSIGSYGLYFLLLRSLSAVKVASFVYLTAPVTMILGWAWFGETLSSGDLGGLLLALMAVILITRSQSPQESQPEEIPEWVQNRKSRIKLASVHAHRITSSRVNLPRGVLLLATVDIEL